MIFQKLGKLIFVCNDLVYLLLELVALWVHATRRDGVMNVARLGLLWAIGCWVVCALAVRTSYFRFVPENLLWAFIELVALLAAVLTPYSLFGVGIVSDDGVFLCTFILRYDSIDHGGADLKRFF